MYNTNGPWTLHGGIYLLVRLEVIPCLTFPLTIFSYSLFITFAFAADAVMRINLYNIVIICCMTTRTRFCSWCEVTARVLSDSDFRRVQIMNIVCCVLTHKSWSTGVKRRKCMYYNLVYYQGLMHIQRLCYNISWRNRELVALSTQKSISEWNLSILL